MAPTNVDYYSWSDLVRRVVGAEDLCGRDFFVVVWSII